MKPLGALDPRQVGPYRLFALLGRGGMGRVFLAAAPDGRLVALKLVHGRHVEEPGFRERFRREVAASRRVSGAYTAPVVDADVETEIPWLATAFVPGPSLRQAVDAAGPLPADTTARLAAGLATALGEIHAAGLVHRDLKPSNVLLAADGPRVIDFGVARVTDSHTSELTRTGVLVGSPGYMSPEQAQSRPLTPASDVFSLGAVLYMACTGTDPFLGASTPATLFNVVFGVPDMELVPEQLRGVIEGCIAKDPAERPTPEEVLARIGAVPTATRAWPAAVHGLIAEQNTAVAAALQDEGGPAAGPAAGPASVSAVAETSPADRTSGVAAPLTTRGREGTTSSHSGGRWTAVVVGTVAAMAVAGAAAAFAIADTGGSPHAASPPVSSSATGAPDSTAPAAPSDPATSSSSDTPVPPAASSSPPSAAPVITQTSPASKPCLTGKQAHDLALQLNLWLPTDASITPVTCDSGWAAAHLSSHSDGIIEIVYREKGGVWTAIEIGPSVCGEVVDGAPADIRSAVNC
jgi:serine/threonine protein kinase